MSTVTVRTTDENIYVGERVYVEIALFNPRTKQPATALAPSLTFTHEDGTVIDGGNMVEVEAGTGVYSGSAVVTEEGSWRVTITVPSPLESRWVYDRLFVNPA
jgi:hypothetical protein